MVLKAVFTVKLYHFMFFFPGDMWYQITAGEGSAYLTERAEDAHHSRDAYEAQPEPQIRYSSQAWAFSTVLNLRLAERPVYYNRNPNTL